MIETLKPLCNNPVSYMKELELDDNIDNLTA